jgi:hypothetical protein
LAQLVSPHHPLDAGTGLAGRPAAGGRRKKRAWRISPCPKCGACWRWPYPCLSGVSASAWPGRIGAAASVTGRGPATTGIGTGPSTLDQIRSTLPDLSTVVILVTGGEASGLASRGHADFHFGKEPVCALPSGGWRAWPSLAQLPFGVRILREGSLGSDQQNQAASSKVGLARMTEARSGPSAKGAVSLLA